MAFEKIKEAIKRKRLEKAYKKEGIEKKAAKAKAKVKAKAKETGKVRRGVKGVESTKGGEYVKYKKKSKAAKSFRSAFAEARKAGKSSFTWDGRSYSTKTADDVKKAKAAKAKTTTKGKTFTKGLEKSAKKASKSRVSTPSAKKQIAEVQKQADLTRVQERLKKHREAVDKAGIVSALSKQEKKKKAGSFGEDREDRSGNYEGGGKVESSGGESNPYGWPSIDARNGGKK